MGTAFTCALLGPLASASVYDLCERRIPNKLVVAMALLWCALMAVTGTGEATARGLVGALVLGGGSLGMACVFERVTGRTSFGGGDVKLLAVLGLYLGVFGGLMCLLVACVGALGLAVVVPRTRFANVPNSTPGQIPFAPALFLGATLCCLLW